ncbi:MAG: hypothetical protein EOO21_02390, partial [Comamonadaceae bacterium]
MIFDRDVSIAMQDGTVLRANVFRPEGDSRHPVVMALGAYGKDVHFEDAYNPQWKVLKQIYPGLDGGCRPRDGTRWRAGRCRPASRWRRRGRRSWDHCMG